MSVRSRWTLLRIADVALVAWVAAWIAVGTAVASELRELSSLSDTVIRVGRAAQEVGRTVDSLADLPLVGDRLDEPSEAIEAAGASAVASGRTSESSVRNASMLLGLAVALIPSLPLLIYLPLRIGWERERRALRTAERSAGDEPAFEAWLARRAHSRMPYDEALHAREPPWTSGDREQTRRLADAELARWGLRRTRRGDGAQTS